MQKIAQIGLERATELKIETTLEQYLSTNIRIRGQDAPSTITSVSHKMVWMELRASSRSII